MAEFPEGHRPTFPSRTYMRPGSKEALRSERFDDLLLKRYTKDGYTYLGLARAYLMGASTIRDRLEKARDRKRKSDSIPTEYRRRMQARAWKEAAVLLDAIELTHPSRRDEMKHLAQQQLAAARRLDEAIGQP